MRCRGNSLVRTLVVAAATLAILLVCFSIYQYSQLSAPARNAVAQPRLPLPPGPSAPSTDPPIAPSGGQGVRLGDTYLDGGRDITLTLYAPEGTQARLEIAVRSWAPLAGAGNQFSLDDPEVRTRTQDGRAVRLTADRGIMEAVRKTGGSLDLRRGRLMGQVLIEIDRLTEDERAALASSEVDPRIDPVHLVRIELDEIEFDLEYDRILVPPGPFHLSAVDVDFQTHDLEVRFNEEAGRVDYLRINDGGRIVLRDVDRELGLSIPDFNAASKTQTRLTDWLRGALVAALEAQAPREPAEETDSTEPAVYEPAGEDDDVPVFRPDSPDAEERAEPPLRYFARFERDVDARKTIGGHAQSRLVADALEIVRAFTAQDKERVRASAPADTPSDADGASPTTRPAEEVTLAWSGRLLLEALTPEDKRWTAEPASTITATGEPVTVSSPDWNASCSTLTFDPEKSAVRLRGGDTQPLTVQAAEQGLMTGREAVTERRGNVLFIRITGPGTLRRGPAPAATESGVVQPEDETPAVIEFTEQMELHGRFVTRRWLNITGGLSTREDRVFDRAEIRGRVNMREGETGLSADAVDVTFSDSLGHADRQSIRQIAGRGHVVMTHGDDRVTSRDIDMAFTTDGAGRTVPVSAEARGDVTATQGERIIRAGDLLTVEFETLDRRPPAPDRRPGGFAGAEDDASDRLNTRDERPPDEDGPEAKVAVKSVKARGDVTIVDPRQQLDLKTEQVECTLVDGVKIRKAILVGKPDHPASVRLKSLSVSGNEIKIDAVDEWAEVPGAGRMIFLSRKNLDGHREKEPIPISVTWEDRMSYRGRENRAVFVGAVHGASATTTLDCSDLLIEFDDVPPPAAQTQIPSQEWWILQGLIDRIAGREPDREELPIAGSGFSKEPTYVLANGKAAVETSVFDEATNAMKSRARLSGPKISVNLREEVSKMLIEGAGILLLEDFRAAAEKGGTPPKSGKGLFSMDDDAGPSKTLIDWNEVMWYDFSAKLASFEGDVHLKHFSGAALDKMFGRVSEGSADLPKGRSTFLSCDLLRADFRNREERRRPDDRRIGGLSAEQLRQFQASGSVDLQDQTEGLFATCDGLTFERDREILVIVGSPRRNAHVVKQWLNRSPTVFNGQRAFYNVRTGHLEFEGSSFRP